MDGMNERQIQDRRGACGMYADLRVGVNGADSVTRHKAWQLVEAQYGPELASFAQDQHEEGPKS